jgi:hypothetical protein
MKKCYKESRRKADWIDYILGSNHLLKHISKGMREERIEVMGRQEIRLLGDLKEKRRYCKLKEAALKFHSLKNLLWKRLWTCDKADNRINDDTAVTKVRNFLYVTKLISCW